MEAIFATFTSPGPSFEIGPFSLRWYGLLIAISVLIGLNLSSYLAKLRGLNSGLINDLLPIIVLSSVIGARLYYVAFKWENYSGVNFWSGLRFLGLKVPIPSFFEIWGGGIAIHGALLGGSISVIIFCRLRKQRVWDVMDVLLPSVALGQSIGRWGNFFNNEAFGVPTSLPWKLSIPYAFRPNLFLDQEFFHPTFLYESLWDLGIFVMLFILFKKNLNGSFKIPSGSISCIYLITYSIGRFWIEGLRTDPLCFGGVEPFCEGGIRMAQIMSIILSAIGTFGLWRMFHLKKEALQINLAKKRSL